MMCAAPAYWATQHWFLLVVVCGFIGTLYFLLHHLSLDAYVKNLALNFTQVVKIYYLDYFIRVISISYESKIQEIITLIIIIKIHYFLNIRSFGSQPLLRSFILPRSPHNQQNSRLRQIILTSSIGLTPKWLLG